MYSPSARCNAHNGSPPPRPLYLYLLYGGGWERAGWSANISWIRWNVLQYRISTPKNAENWKKFFLYFIPHNGAVFCTKNKVIFQCWLIYLIFIFFKYFLWPQVEVPPLPWVFTVYHNDPAAPQDHCGRCRIRTGITYGIVWTNEYSNTIRYPLQKPVLWIQIHWWIRIQDFNPIWIRIQGYTINFERKNSK